MDLRLSLLESASTFRSLPNVAAAVAVLVRALSLLGLLFGSMSPKSVVGAVVMISGATENVSLSEW